MNTIRAITILWFTTTIASPSHSSAQELGSNKNSLITKLTSASLTTSAGSPAHLAVSPNGQYVAIGRTNGTIEVFEIGGNPESFALKGVLSIPSSVETWSDSSHKEWVLIHGDAVKAITFVSTSTFVAASGAGLVITVDAATMTQVSSVQFPLPIACLDAKANGTEFLVGTDRGEIAEYSEKGILKTAFRFESADSPAAFSVSYVAMGTMAFSALEGYNPTSDVESTPAGAILNGGPTLWDTNTGLRLARIAAPSGNVLSLDLDGTRLLLTSDSRSTGYVTLNSPYAWTEVSAQVRTACDVIDTTPPQILSASPRKLYASNVTTFETVIEGRDTDYGYTQVAIKKRPSSNSFVVLTKTSVELFEYTVRGGQSTAVVRAESLGSHLGYDVAITHELRGFDNDVEEIAVSSDGQHVIARGTDGTVILWARTGAGFDTTVLPLNVGDLSSNRSLFSLTQWGLLAVKSDGTVCAASVPFTPPCTSKLFFDGASSVHVSSIAQISATRAIAGLEDGRLCELALDSEQVLQTIVPSTNTTRFVRFVRDVQTSRIIAIPERARANGHQLTIVSTPACSVVSTVVDGRWNAPRGSAAAPGIMAVSGGSRQGTFYYDITGSTSTIVARAPETHVIGLGQFNQELLLGLSRGKATLQKLVSGVGSVASLVVNDLPFRSIAGAPNDNSVYIGLDSGTILRLTATPSP